MRASLMQMGELARMTGSGSAPRSLSHDSARTSYSTTHRLRR